MDIEKRLLDIEQEIKNTQILLRVNNLLLSRFILQLSKTRDDLGLPKRNVFFKFELLEEDYNELVERFGKKETDKALYRLDRLLLSNKQQCPHNIKKYISTRLLKKEKNKVEKDNGNNV